MTLMKKIRRDARTDRGAVMIWFAASVVVSLGMGALVIDMGALWSERRQLQNGADAAALAVGIECAAGPCSAPQQVAQEYADLNVHDGSANIDSICGMPSPLVSCPPPAGAENAIGFVEVITGTRSGGGSDEVKYLLAPVLDGTNTGKHVTARAVAAWGTPMGAPILPIVFSKCETQRFRNADGTMSFPNQVIMLTFHDTTSDLDINDPSQVCNSNLPPDQRWPAGYGFTGSASTGCESETVNLNPYPGYGTQTGTIDGENNGNSIAQACTDELIRRYTLGLPVLVPVMIGRTGNGGTTVWEVDGFISVTVCAFDLVSNAGLELDGCRGQGGIGNTTCTAQRVRGQMPRRICGVFEPYTLTDGDLGNSTDYGTRVIKLIG